MPDVLAVSVFIAVIIVGLIGLLIEKVSPAAAPVPVTIRRK